MKSNAFVYLIDKFQSKYKDLWVFAMKPYITKEKANLKWIGAVPILIVDRKSAYRNRLARYNSGL